MSEETSHIRKIRIIPEGAEAKPLFATEEEYQEFRRRYADAVREPMKRAERALALSWHLSAWKKFS